MWNEIFDQNNNSDLFGAEKKNMKMFHNLNCSDKNFKSCLFRALLYIENYNKKFIKKEHLSNIKLIHRIYSNVH